MSTPIETANAYFTALADGDMTTVAGLMSPDIEWHQPGANQFSGVHRGTDAVGAIVGGMARVTGGSFAVAVAGEPMANGDLVAVPVRFTGERDGHQLDMTGIDLLQIESGRITRVDLFSQDQSAEDDFWG